MIINATSSSGGNLYFTLNGITQVNSGYFDDLPAGPYICTITDEAGCSIEIPVEITTLILNYLEALAGKSITCLGNTARVPLNVSKFIDVKSFETTLVYNAALMECKAYGSVQPQLIEGLEPIFTTIPGVVKIKWNGTDILTLPDSTVLLELAFSPKVFGSSTIDWDESAGVSHFLDQNGIEIPVVYTKGSVIINNPPKVEDHEIKTCENNYFTYNPGILGGTDPLTHIWKTPSGSVINDSIIEIYSATPDDAGTYELIVTDSVSCADTAKVEVKIIPLPDAGFASDTVYFEREITLQANPGYASYYWNTGETTSQIFIDQDGIYSVQIQTAEECLAEESITAINTFVEALVPNAFTPNDDGLNDTFHPYIDQDRIKRYHLTLFNLWGEMLFESFSISDSWDGNNASPGVYNWKLEFENRQGKLYSLQGFVSLLK